MLPYGCGSCGSHPCLHFFRERKESSHFPQITHFHFPLVWAASHILKAQWRGEKNLHLMAAENPTPSSLQPIHLLFPLSWCPNPVHSASLGSDLPRLLSACFVRECLEQGAWLCDLALMFYQQSQWRACKLEVPMCPQCGQKDMPPLCVVCISMFAQEEHGCQVSVAKRRLAGSKAKFKWKYSCI